MKKILLLLGLGAILLLVPLSVQAEETLLNNQLDLKTDRLNKEQTGEGQAKNISVDDRLFNTEQIKKRTAAEKKQQAERQQELGELFLTNVPKNTKHNMSSLFIPKEKKATAVPQNTSQTEKASEQSNTMILPLLGTAAFCTVMTVVIYQIRKRGTKHGRKQGTY